jgi:hypothetical protein
MGKGLHSKFFALQTLLTKSGIMPIALMNGRPRIRLTATLGPAVTRREVQLSSLVLGSIRKVDVKPDVEFSCDGRRVQYVKNTGEDNGRVIVGNIDLL